MYARSCNLELDGQAQLLPLLDASLPLQAHALSLRLPEGSSCFSDWFTVQAGCYLSERRLELGGLRLARPHALAEEAYRLDGLDGGALFRLEGWPLAAMAQVRTQGVLRPVGELNCLHPWVWPALENCLHVLCDRALLGPCCAKAIGLGAGLTPSGDDFLCGLLAVTYLADATAFAEIATAIRGDLPATTRVSQDYLRLACDGIFSPLICCMLRALVEGSREALADATRHLLAHGSSSGMDTMAGIAWGVHALSTRLR